MPAMSHVFGLFGIDACKIYPMTADPIGGSTTYGAGVSVPGIRDLNITPDMLSKELYGDGEILAQRSKVRGYKATASHARLNLDALAIFLGGTVADASTTPTRVTTFDDTVNLIPGVFKLEAQVLSVDGDVVGDDVHITLWKATVDTVSLGGQMEDFAVPSLSFTGVRQNGSARKRLTITHNEAVTALSA